MAPAKDKSLFVGSRTSGSILLAVALASFLAAASLAQDAGVSGIPPGACEWVELQKPFLQRADDAAADPAAHDQARNTDYRRAAQSDAVTSRIKPCPHGASAILVVARTAHCRQGE